MANYPQEVSQDAIARAIPVTFGLWVMPSPAFKAEY